jgi:hypothetical protein
MHSYANLGIYSWSVATKDPKQDDMLPMDDTAWDQGVSYSMTWALYIENVNNRR